MRGCTTHENDMPKLVGCIQVPELCYVVKESTALLQSTESRVNRLASSSLSSSKPWIRHQPPAPCNNPKSHIAYHIPSLQTFNVAFLINLISDSEYNRICIQKRRYRSSPDETIRLSQQTALSCKKKFDDCYNIAPVLN